MQEQRRTWKAIHRGEGDDGRAVESAAIFFGGRKRAGGAAAREL